MASIHNMIHAEIEGAAVGTHACVNIRLSGGHTITIFQDSQAKSAAIAAAINEAVARHDAANTEPVSPPQN